RLARRQLGDCEHDRVYFPALVGSWKNDSLLQPTLRPLTSPPAMHCHRFAPRPVSRRQMLKQCAAGFGSVALAALLGERSAQGRVLETTHHPAKAKKVIFLYMDGGVSQVDSFDPKP